MQNSLTGADQNVDANGGGCDTSTPVENINWPVVEGSDATPVYGLYSAEVDYYT